MSARRLAVLAAAALVAACSDLHITTAVQTIEVAITHPSWQYDVAPVLGETCATSGACHKGANAANGLDLEPGQSYASVVNVRALRDTTWWRVRPGFADSSALYFATSGVVAERHGFYRMPLTEYLLPDPVRQTIRNWINDGAKDN